MLEVSAVRGRPSAGPAPKSTVRALRVRPVRARSSGRSSAPDTGPFGVAYGTCVYQQVTTNATKWITGSRLLNGAARVNQELREYTFGFYDDARRLAVQYAMEQGARRCSARRASSASRIEKQIARSVRWKSSCPKAKRQAEAPRT